MVKEYEERINNPWMEYYREVYKNSKRWDNDSFDGKRVVVYMEQGFGDQIMFLRFVRFLKEFGATPVLHAPKQMLRLITEMGYECFDKDEEVLPEHDFHVLSLSLPHILQQVNPNFAIPLEPYIKVEGNFDEYKDKTKRLNIGLTWEGNHQHESNRFRSCPFKHFFPLFQPDIEVWGAAPLNQDPTGEYPFWEGVTEVEMCHINHKDFLETAKLYNSLDYIVSVDTATIHLAGAMGKPAFLILGKTFMDPRWTGLWYPTVKILKGRWDDCVAEVVDAIKKPG